MPNQSQYWALTDFSGAGQAGSGAELFVIVDGVEVPIAQFSMTYGLNAIPSATALVALGREARTSQPSAIYDVVSQVKQMAEVRVEIRGQLGDWSPQGNGNGGKKSWPGGTHIIFVGYVSGISYRRSLGRVSMVLNMVNQLVDLAMSSGGSADVVPGAPHDLMMPTLAEGPGGAPIGTASSKFVEELPADLNTDFSKGLLKALYFVSQKNQLQIHKAWCDGDVGASGPAEGLRANTKASRVIEGFGYWKGIKNYKGTSKYTQAYPLDIHSQGREHTAQRIGDTIAASLAGTSMWGMLIGSIIPEFGCFLIPTAEEAYLAPVIPMCRESSKFIGPSDYADFNLRTMSQRPLYGVAVMGNYSTATIARPGSDNKQCVGASFVAKANDGGDANDGMWMFVPAPRWMDDWTNYDPEALQGNASVDNMLSKPAHDAVGVDQAAIKRNPDDEVDDWNDVLEKYAQMVYAGNSLRGREGTIVGKLRFDICPGTTVLVKSKGELKSAGVDELASDMYGMVSRVTVTINSEQASAATTLELTNLRTDVENLSDRFSMQSHPFFNSNFFKYAPLVSSLEIS